VLARVEGLEGVDHAQIEYRGDFLRLSLSDVDALASTAELLKVLGYESERAGDAEVRTVSTWYDTESVGDLSRVEASVIADRILPSFVLIRKLSPDQTDGVRNAVVDALHNCFVRTALANGPSLGEFRISCVRAVEDTARPIVGPASARTLAELLNADLTKDHRG
jgi:ABC-type dipeptide/oligopeptide/nickel transport system permease component